MKKSGFGNAAEALIYPALLLAVMWMFQWAQVVTDIDFVRLGIRPKHPDAWAGLLFMPLIHSPGDLAHIINNSFPTYILLAALIYYYREVALRVFLLSWLFTGLGVWLFANDEYSYHIGMSGVIYALFGFLFISGFFRRVPALQAITLMVVFVYGSMFWGILPQKGGISWEGHMSGLAIGVVLGVLYRNRGPQPRKFQYEIEKELGIEPPDLEGIYNQRLAEMERLKEEQERQRQEMENRLNFPHIVYHIRPKDDEDQGTNTSGR